MPGQSFFTPKLFAFLRELEVSNERPWFEANKERYLRDLRDPTLRFIEDFAPRLARISKAFVADARPQGGSMFRIHRDTRFGKDKRPYKTHVGMQFRHQAGRDVHAPGFYLHLEPGSVFAGAGIYHPDGQALAAIRGAIEARPAEWKKITRSAAFTRTLELGGDSLKRPPRGVDPDHPLIDDLKRKDFFAHAGFSEKQACQPGFLDEVAATFKACAPLTRFLTSALDLPF